MALIATICQPNGLLWLLSWQIVHIIHIFFVQAYFYEILYIMSTVLRYGFTHAITIFALISKRKSPTNYITDLDYLSYDFDNVCTYIEFGENRCTWIRIFEVP